MLLFLVRHAKALPRASWRRAGDLERPLDATGERQAEALVPLLRSRLPSHPPPSLLSSPALRCLQTLDPFAVAMGVPVSVDSRLVESGHLPASERPEPAAAPAWLADRASEAIHAAVAAAGDKSAIVVCTHGEVLPPLLARLCPDLPDGKNQKGGFWVLELDRDDCIGDSEYVPAP